MSRSTRASTPEDLDRRDRRMAPGGRFLSESPVRPIQNKKALLQGIGPVDPGWIPPEPVETAGWLDPTVGWMDPNVSWLGGRW